VTAERTRYSSIVFDSARWEGFDFREGDIVISTPPKCGTTWTQMICGLLIFQTADLPRPLDLLSPWFDMLTRSRADVVTELDAQAHRRFIKSHTPFDGLPYDERVTYIAVGRDPRDVYMSWDNHMSNLDLMQLIAAREKAVGLDDIMDVLEKGPTEFAESIVDRFWDWVDRDVAVAEFMSLHATLYHLTSFWNERNRPNVVLLHYDDLKRDLEGEMRSLAKRLAIDVPEQHWPALVDAAGFESMRTNADRVAPDTANRIWQSNTNFFNRGTSGQWRE
jgi:aryl sulfotransferase